MTVPTGYELSYDFTGFQSANPNTPLPADKVEIEFNNLEQTTDEIISNLSVIQRSDTALQNGIVTFDALSATVKALLGTTMVPRGDWVTGTAYAALDLVDESSSVYICVTAHTSGTFATDLAAGKWMVWSYAGSADIVTGPASSVDGDIAQFDGVTGKVIKGGIAIGTAANNLVRLTAAAKLPAVDGSLLTGTVQSVVAGDGISVDATTPESPIITADVLIDAAQTFSGAQRTTASALTSASAHIAINLALNNDFTHTLTEDTTLDNPTNITAGQKGRITITQAASAKTLAYGSYWDFAGGTVPTVSTGSGEIDVLYYDVLTTTKIACSLVKDIS